MVGAFLFRMDAFLAKYGAMFQSQYTKFMSTTKPDTRGYGYLPAALPTGPW